MARVIEYTAKDYSDALSKVGTWIAENAEYLIGNDIKCISGIDLNINIEPDCIIMVDCNKHYITFCGNTPIILKNNESQRNT